MIQRWKLSDILRSKSPYQSLSFTNTLYFSTLHGSSCPGVEAGGASAGGDEEAQPADQGHGGSGQGHPGHVGRRVGDKLETKNGIVSESKTDGRVCHGIWRKLEDFKG